MRCDERVRCVRGLSGAVTSGRLSRGEDARADGWRGGRARRRAMLAVMVAQGVMTRGTLEFGLESPQTHAMSPAAAHALPFGQGSAASSSAISPEHRSRDRTLGELPPEPFGLVSTAYHARVAGQTSRQ